MPETVVIGGVERGLGWQPSLAATIARLHREKKLSFSHDHPKLAARAPQADWAESSCEHFWKYRKNQASTSMCVGGSGAHVLSTSFAKAGFDVDISPAAIYAPICGGSDNGANMADALEAMQKYGAFPSGFAGIGDFDWRMAYRSKFWQEPQSSIGQGAAKYKILEAVFCGDDVDAFLDGLQSGQWCGQFGMGAGRNFETDADGWLPSWDRTGINHALFATGGMKKHPRNGTWGIEGGNSWGGDWGLNGVFWFDPADWLPHNGQELWLCRSATIPR